MPAADGGWTVGALVQANYGDRDLLRIDGVPVGEAIPLSEVPSAWDDEAAIDGHATSAQPALGSSRIGPGGGSIIVVLATDAPLLPHQCERLAQRATLGLGRMGSYASHGSGDLFIAFATGNRGLSRTAGERDPRQVVETRMVVDRAISPLFQAAVEATEAAVVERHAQRRDAHGPRRDHRARPRPRSAARRHGALRSRAARASVVSDLASAAIRLATVDDIPAIRRILAAHEDDGAGRRRVASTSSARTSAISSSGTGRWSASGTVGVVAFGSVLDTGRARMLADLFVEPERLGMGLGRPLLTALFEDAPVRATFASSDPRALPLYVRAGMTPLWVCLYVEGEAADSCRPSIRRSPCATRPPDELAALEAGLDGRLEARRPRLLGRPAAGGPVRDRGR